MALYLTDDDVTRLLPMKEAILAVRGAFAAEARGEASLTPRARVRTGGAILNVMAGAMAGEPPGAPGYLGMKCYSVARGAARFLFLLYSAEDGELLSIMEADQLGRIRTGAASGVATDFMARREASVAAIVGAGGQAPWQIRALAAVRELRAARVFSRDETKRRAFAAGMARELAIEVIPAASAEEAVRGAEIVSTITTSKEPVVHGAWLEEGAHVNAAGANHLARRELDTEAVARAAVIAVDSREQARIEAGDLMTPLAEGALDWDRVRELRDIVGGAAPARGSARDITLFKSLGVGLEDVAAGGWVYRKALREGAGREIAGL